MFATYLGDKYLPSNIPAKDSPLAWSATISSSDGTIFLKVSTLQPLIFMTKMNLTIL